MKFLNAYTIATVLIIGVTAPSFAQDFPGAERVGDQLCTTPDSEMHADLDARGQIPDCLRYCTVDKSQTREFREFPGLVFACAQFDPGVAAPLETAGTQGLAGGAGGVMAGVALLLGLGVAGGGGSTSGTN